MPAKKKHRGFTTFSLHKRGFTLIELMITIAIIAVLATVASVVYSSVQKSARISKRIQDLDALKTAVETYKASNGFYPKATAAGCIGLAGANNFSNATAVSPAFAPTYMQALPRDPSNSTGTDSNPCYSYKADTNGTEYKIWTTTTEMTNAEFLTQPNYIDPARDVGATNGGTDSCKVDGSTPAAWAVYSSAGTASTNACAF